MAQAKRKWLGRLLALSLLAVLVAGGWYAYTQGWLVPVQNWLSQRQTTGSPKEEVVPANPTIWTCAMHPQVRQDHPGRCPICGMNLVRVRSEEANKAGEGSTSTAPMGTPSTVPGHATVMIPGELQQRIGVRIGQVEKGPLTMSVNALGIIQPNETQVARVNIKTEGWVDKLFVNFVGQMVRKGDPLLSIYSPNFLSTQQELLNALRSEQTVGGSQQSMSVAARRRLELWDVPPDEIEHW